MPDASQLLHTAEAAFDLAVPHGMPRAGHSHTGRALCTRDYCISKKWKFKLDLGCKNDAPLLTYTFNKECLIFNES